jgi:hypothetical protein
MPVPIEKFGKDHWSTLLYVKARAVDFKGLLEMDRMRTDLSRHPQYATPLKIQAGGTKKYPTRLSSGEKLLDHDDWECLDDLVAAGLLVSTGTGIHPAYQPTLRGWEIVSRLRQRLATGNRNYAGFDWR